MINLYAFSSSFFSFLLWPEPRSHKERRLLLPLAARVAALIALPGGFLLGAFGGHGGDPGVGIALVPFGLVMLVIALIGTLRRLPR